MLDLFFDAAWKVLVAGLVLGAGIPAMFALGIRFSSAGASDEDAPAAPATTRALPLTLGTACFVVAGLAVALGLTVIIATGFGKVVSFDHVFPTLVDKA